MRALPLKCDSPDSANFTGHSYTWASVGDTRSNYVCPQAPAGSPVRASHMGPHLYLLTSKTMKKTTVSMQTVFTRQMTTITVTSLWSLIRS